MKERNLNYDLIRFLGLVVIMLAHSSPPEWIFQLRNFGTPLLVIGSGLTYALIYTYKEMEIRQFFKKRVARLIFPAWMFLSFFFFSFYLAAEFVEKEYPFSLYKIISSYFLMGGIGFVWVFKIYLMLALMTPVALSFNRSVNSNVNYFVALIVLYILYELTLYFLTPYLQGAFESLFNSIIFILAPYSLLYLYAFRLASLKNNTILIIIALSFSTFLALAFVKHQNTGSFVPSQEYKYPPTIYYFSYAFFATNLIFFIVKGVKLTGFFVRKVLVWLSSNSLWIYLWHIFAFYLWAYLFPDPKGNVLLFLVKTAFLFSLGIMCTIIQNTLVSIISVNNHTFKNKIAPLLSGSA